jgi:peroxiredoxin
MAVAAAGAFPRLSLPALAGGERPLDTAWAKGEALIVLGHRNCKTTRETLPYVDRLHRRKGGDATVLAVLQDDAETAATLVREQGFELPVLLEADPYPLAAALGLVTVPTLFLVRRDGRIEKAVEGFDRAEIEGFAARLGVAGSLFVPEDKAPAFKPG